MIFLAPDIYDRQGGQLIASSTSKIDNVEQLAVENRNTTAGETVITLYADDDGNGVEEAFALASSQALEPLRGPIFAANCQVPTSAPANSLVSIRCTVTNQGDLETLQSEARLASGSVTLATASLGAIFPGQSRTETFAFRTGSQGSLPVRLTVRGDGFGIFIEPFFDNTLTVGAPTVACSYSLSSTSASLPVSGGAASVTIATSAGCAWSVSGNPGWLSITSPSNSAGSGMLSLSATVNPGAERVSALTIAGQPFTLRQLGTATVPSIARVMDAASSGTVISSGSWVSIFGANLSRTTRTWASSDLVSLGRRLPTTLDGVSVTINGRPAVVAYISPSQINALAPDDSQMGTVLVTVSNNGAGSNSFSVAKQRTSPTLFTYTSGTTVYAAATHPDGTLVAPEGLFPGTGLRPASRGGMITLYATGCGPTSPATPSGEAVAVPAPVAGTVRVLASVFTLPVSYAGIVSPGLCQFNITVPSSMPVGNVPIILQVDSSESRALVVLPIR